MTFAGFQQLLTTKAYRSAIGRLLAEWYGYTIVGDGGESLSLISNRNLKSSDLRNRSRLRVAAKSLAEPQIAYVPTFIVNGNGFRSTS